MCTSKTSQFKLRLKPSVPFMSLGDFYQMMKRKISWSVTCPMPGYTAEIVITNSTTITCQWYYHVTIYKAESLFIGSKQCCNITQGLPGVGAGRDGNDETALHGGDLCATFGPLVSCAGSGC